jgi:hypothetical protein
VCFFVGWKKLFSGRPAESLIPSDRTDTMEPAFAYFLLASQVIRVARTSA